MADLLAETGIGAADVTRLAVTVGPGSFMGARVGISFAKGFGFARRVPAVPLTTLEALWLSAEAEEGAVLIDARRGEVYCQTFGTGGGAPALLSLGAARERIAALPDGAALIGSGVPLVAEERKSDGPLFPDPVRMAMAALSAAEGPLVPLYLRAPDAKPPRR